MKLCGRVCFLLITVAIICIDVFAGDLPSALILEPDADLFLGEITEITENNVSIEVTKAFFEAYEVSNITLEKFNYVAFDDAAKTPDVGDYCVVAAKYADNGWHIWPDKLSGLAAKSDSLNPETLTLYNLDAGFTKDINYFIKNGDYTPENRIRMLKLLDKDNEGEASKAEQAEFKSIAENTPIVIPPPIVPIVKKKKPAVPISKYILLTVSAATISYCLSRKLQRKPLWDKKGNKSDD